MPIYENPSLESSVIHDATGDALERLGALDDMPSLQREVRELHDPELERIAQKIKDADSRLRRGECVPPNDVRELIAFVRRNAEVLS